MSGCGYKKKYKYLPSYTRNAPNSGPSDNKPNTYMLMTWTACT